MSKAILPTVPLTAEDIKNLFIPLRDKDGGVLHQAEIGINQDRLRQVIGETGLTNPDKRKIHIIVNEMVKVLNETGIHQYLPDKFKPVLAPLFAMVMLTDGDFIGGIQ